MSNKTIDLSNCDKSISFQDTVTGLLQKKNYISLKRTNRILKIVFWDRKYFEDCHGKREKYEKSKNGEKAQSSLTRAQNRVFDLIECNLNQYEYKPVFLTLTYQEKNVDIETANKDFTSFIRKLKYLSGINPAYVCVTEFQKRGTPHFHIIFFNLPFIFVSSQARRKLKKKSIFDFNWNDIWVYGDVNVKKIRNNYKNRYGKVIKNGCAAYMTKYLSKQFQDERLYGKKTYFASRNLIKPYKYYSPLNHQTYDSVSEIVNSLFGLSGNIETTLYKPDEDFVVIEGFDLDENNNLLKKLSGRKI